MNSNSEKYALKKRLIFSEKKYTLIQEFLTSVISKVRVGHNKDAENLNKRLTALHEISAEDLRRAGVDRAILRGQVELLAKLAILTTSNSGKVNKSTNTQTEAYTDLAEDSSIVLKVTAKILGLTKNQYSSFAAATGGRSIVNRSPNNSNTSGIVSKYKSKVITDNSFLQEADRSRSKIESNSNSPKYINSRQDLIEQLPGINKYKMESISEITQLADKMPM